MIKGWIDALKRAWSLEDRRWRIDRHFVVGATTIGFFPKHETWTGGWVGVDNPDSFGDYAFLHHADAAAWIEKNYRPRSIAPCDPTETRRPENFVENFRKHGRRYRPAGEDFPV